MGLDDAVRQSWNLSAAAVVLQNSHGFMQPLPSACLCTSLLVFARAPKCHRALTAGADL